MHLLKAKSYSWACGNRLISQHHCLVSTTEEHSINTFSERYIHVLCIRIDPDLWYGRGVRLVTWTVNSDDEKTHFENVLRMPYMTDYVRRQGQATKQTQV